MKANSRRRVLISSLAMLLVALVALSTATFAWFTQSTTSTASGITVRTSKTSQLQISDDSRAYSAAGFTYEGFSSVMVPASSSNGKDWFYTEAKDASAFTAKSTTSFTQVPTDATRSKYVFADQLCIKNAGEVDIDDITITVNNFAGSDYVKFALVPVSQKMEGGDTTMTAKAFQENVYGITSNDTAANLDNTTYYPVASTSAISTTAITPKSATTAISVPKIEAGDEAFYNLYVWFEGQDPKCFDGKAGEGITNLSFTVAGTPVSETE